LRGEEARREAEEAVLQVAAALHALPRGLQALEAGGLAERRPDGRFKLSKKLRKKALKAARAGRPPLS